MSESEEDVTVDAEGVSVRKTLNDHQFETLAVVFDVRSSRDAAARVTLIDEIPGDVPVDDVGFHPEYGGEQWEAEGDRIVFSRTFEPGEQYTTVYGVRDFDGDRGDLLTDPTIEIGEPEAGVTGAGETGDETVGGDADEADDGDEDGGSIDDIDELVSEEDGRVVREVISGDRDTLPGLEDESAAADGEPVEASADAEGAVAGAAAGAGPSDAATGEVGADAEPLGEESDDEAVTDAIGGTDDGARADADAAEVVGDEEIDSPGHGPGADAEASAGIEAEEADEGVGAGDDLAKEEDDVGSDEAVAVDAGVGSAVDESADVDADATAGADVDDETTADAGEELRPSSVDEPAADESETGVGSIVTDVGGDATPVDEADGPEGEDRPVAGEPEASGDEEARTADVHDAGDDREITVPVTGGIARVLAKELRAGNVSYEDRRLLREELLPDDGSTDARIRHLQSQVADIAAYTDALEQFLDEEGGAEAVLDRIEERTDALAADVEDVEEAIEDVDESVEAVEDDVEAVEDDVDQVSGDVAQVSGSVERLQGDLESVRDEVERIDEVDRRLGDVEDDVAAIQDEIEELAAFRDRLSSVFGPGGMGGADEGDEE